MTPIFKRVSWTVFWSVWLGYMLYWPVATSECASNIKPSIQKHCSWNETVDFVRSGGSVTMWLGAIAFTIMWIVMLFGQRSKANK